MEGLDPDLRALQEVRDYVARAKAACAAVRDYDQARIDRICEAMARAGADAAAELGRLAVEETGIGRVHYKILKNLFGSEGVWASIRDERTVGIVSRDEASGVLEVATPVGVVAAIIPTTNPTSTALGKALIAVKGRNAVVISPHPRARRCIGQTAEVLRQAIERAGGPPDLVLSLGNPTIESTGALMKHRHVAIILATGGSGLVNAAYSSGKPAYGVGPGNVPVYVDRTADLPLAAQAIISSQSFDNATLCCSEQALVVDRPVLEPLLAEMISRGAHVCSDAEVHALEAYCNHGGHMNPDVVGKDPSVVARAAGFEVPKATSLLIAPQSGVGREHPLSIEILCPLLSLHAVEGWKEGCQVSMDVLHYGGLGHTCAVWARDERVLEAWFLEKPANRILANGPSSQGAVGYSTGLVPSMSLGCGPQAGNITSDNITARHLINLKRIARPTRDWAETSRRDHARAAALFGEDAPRGSGLPGDPALSIASRSGHGAGPETGASDAFERSTGWSGDPGSDQIPRRVSRKMPRPTESGELASRPAATPASSASIALSAPAVGVSAPAAPRFTAPRAAAQAGPKEPGAHVGEALSAAEIRSIMAGAGAGCPLGPCQGCPHLEVTTGACRA